MLWNCKCWLERKGFFGYLCEVKHCRFLGNVLINGTHPPPKEAGNSPCIKSSYICARTHALYYFYDLCHLASYYAHCLHMVYDTSVWLFRFFIWPSLPVWHLTCESVKYSTDSTVSSVRNPKSKILVSVPSLFWIRHSFLKNIMSTIIIAWNERGKVLNCLKTPLLPITVAAVLGKIYELLGALGEVHPSEMVSNSEKLYKAFLGELKEQVRSGDAARPEHTSPAAHLQTFT